jgi:hypothetical protein
MTKVAKLHDLDIVIAAYYTAVWAVVKEALLFEEGF